jgi:hypothetical protein
LQYSYLVYVIESQVHDVSNQKYLEN